MKPGGMTEHDLEPLPQELDNLLEAERTRPGLDATARGRLYSRVAASVAVVGLVGAGAAASHAAGTSAGATATSTLSALFARKITIGVAAFLFGGIAGAGAHAYATHKAEPKNEPAKVAAAPVNPVQTSAPAVVAPPAPTPVSDPNVSVPAVATGTPTGVVVASVASAPDTRKEENALVTMAQNALARGDSAAALAALDDHAKRFPGGKMAEEREALAVRALVMAGRKEEARTRGERFKKTFKGSMFLPVVDGALGSSP